MFSNHCKVNLDVKISFDSNIYKLAYSGRINIIKIRDFIYKKSYSEIELGRKRNIAFSDNVCFKPRSIYCMSVVSKNLNTNEFKFYLSQTDAKKDGFDSRRVSECVSGKRLRYKGHTFRKALEDEIKHYKDM